MQIHEHYCDICDKVLKEGENIAVYDGYIEHKDCRDRLNEIEKKNTLELENPTCNICEKKIDKDKEEYEEYEIDDGLIQHYHKKCHLLDMMAEATQKVICCLCDKEIGYAEYPDDISQDIYCVNCKKSKKGK